MAVESVTEVPGADHQNHANKRNAGYVGKSVAKVAGVEASGHEDARYGLVATGSKVIVIQNEVEKVGSILMTDNSKDLGSMGTIVAVGPMIKNPEITVGLRCVFGPYDGISINIDGDRAQRVRILDETSIQTLVYNFMSDEDWEKMRDNNCRARRAGLRAQIALLQALDAGAPEE